MMNRRFLIVAVLALFLAGSAPAYSPAVGIESLSVAGSQVKVAVHNTDAASRTVRVQVSVIVVGGVQQTLTSGDVTVPAGATVWVTLSASGGIVAIGDDPQPILPSY